MLHQIKAIRNTFKEDNIADIYRYCLQLEQELSFELSKKIYYQKIPITYGIDHYHVKATIANTDLYALCKYSAVYGAYA